MKKSKKSIPDPSTALEIIDLTDIVIFKLDDKLNFCFFNKAAAKLFKCDDLLGRACAEFELFVSPEYKTITKALKKKQSLNTEFYSHPYGRWFELSLRPADDGGIVCYCKDIHTKKLITADAQIKKDGKKSSERSIEKIKQQEVLLREAEKIGHMGSWQRNLETGELTWSDELYRIYGLKHGENVITTKYFLEKVVHPEDKHLVKKHIHDMYKKQIEYAMEYRIMTKDGPKIVYSKPKITFSSDKKKVIDIRGIVRDITAQKKAEEQILILKLSQQKEILNTILHVQEAERSRIGESLHNGIGQLLYAIKLKHESLGSKIPEYKNTLSEINNLLAEAITETRNISFELVPNLLKDFGLNMALKELCKTGMRHACEIKYTPAEIKDRLPQQLEMAIFRIVQEIINNIIKHAKATKAAVSLRITKKEIIVKVNDNGVGFNTRKTFSSGSGFGLRNIKSRVQLFNGELDIVSKKGKGTSVAMKFPVN